MLVLDVIDKYSSEYRQWIKRRNIKNLKKRTQKKSTIPQIDIYEEIIRKMQNKLHEDPSHLFSLTMNPDYTQKWEFYQKDLLKYFKALWNYLSLIQTYKGDLSIDEELKFVEEHLESFDFELTKNVESFDSIKSKRTLAQREIELIDVKLDEIKLKLR